jgi:hypothetical protein
VLVATSAAAYGVHAATSGGRAAAGPPCTATVGTTSVGLDFEQAANATTIAAVGKSLGLPDHAVTVGLAAALQESRLRNLPYGDRDSLGLFQQRPSQGWGTPAQIQTPSYAAGAFFRHLATVAGWQTMPVADAAQAVQRSAAPEEYGRWEPQATVMAQALTGEVAAGFTCRLRVGPPTPTVTATMGQAMATELGPVDLGAPAPAPRGWVIATWLIGHARQYRVSTVSFAGRRWTAADGKWAPERTVTSQVVVNGGAVPAQASVTS